MKNPPDIMAFIEMGILSSMSLSVGLYIFSGMEAWSGGEDANRFAVGAAVCIIFALILLAFAFTTQIIKRPCRVDMDDELTLHWRFRSAETVPFDSIKDMYIDPRAPDSIVTRWTSGFIGFKGKKMRFGFTYEILMAVRHKYLEEFGHYPPSSY